MSEKTENKIVIITDSIGRNIIGREVETTETEIKLANPGVMSVNTYKENPQDPNEHPKIQVQLFPYFFKEFVTPETREDSYWAFKRSQVVESNIQLEPNIVNQYQRIIEGIVAEPVAPAGDEKNVVKLFDDEDESADS